MKNCNILIREMTVSFPVARDLGPSTATSVTVRLETKQQWPQDLTKFPLEILTVVFYLIRQLKGKYVNQSLKILLHFLHFCLKTTDKFKRK